MISLSMSRLSVLFVCSGNHPAGISTVVKNQADSLTKHDVQVDFFTIKGRGVWGYVKNIPVLRKQVTGKRYDLVHAHYSLSGICAALAAPRGIPVFCSLMGSDTKMTGIWRLLIRWFAKKRWRGVIIKSLSMNAKLALKDFFMLPNGVNLKQIRPIDQTNARERIGWDSHKRYVLFLADPERPEKNFTLAQEAVSHLQMENLELKAVGACVHADVPLYLNACDVLLLTSLWEGSPNVVKEAMACDRPIVSTDVGDVRWILGNTRGCFVSTFHSDDAAENLRSALEFSGKEGSTTGRQRIRALGLDSDAIAKQLIDLYKRFLSSS